jgi:hypothetical protein
MMKKILVTLLTVIFLVSLSLAMNVNPVSATGEAMTLSKSGELELAPDGNCYAYVITYTYTVTNTGTKNILVDLISDDILGAIPLDGNRVLNRKNLTTGETDSISFYAKYPVPYEYINENDTISNTAIAHANTVAAIPFPFESNEATFTIYLPQYIMPSAWYLNETTLPAGYEMDWVPVGGTHSELGGVGLNPAATGIWLSEPAEDTTTYEAGDWTLLVHTPQSWSDQPTVKVGLWDGSDITGPYASFSSWTWEYIPGAPTNPPGPYPNFEYTIKLHSSQPIVIDTGDYLALQITNQDSEEVVIVTCHKVGGTYLVPPPTTPSESVPELPAGLLLGIGLAGVGTFVVIKRRKASSLS